tara:strand:- start:36 stop:338 length:303 start_codon:yes stop_codon:yes gene_type:complete
VKLVRDKIPEIIEKDGKWCLCRSVHSKEEHMQLLKEKMIEESEEFLENPCYEEAADMLEIVHAFCYLSGLTFDLAESVMRDKRESNGGFLNGIVLEEVGK